MATATTRMSEQTRKRIEAAREASRLVKKLPEWKLAGLQLTSAERGSSKPAKE